MVSFSNQRWMSAWYRLSTRRVPQPPAWKLPSRVPSLAMDATRRTLCLSLPVFAVTALAADNPGAPIASFAKPFDTLPVHHNGANLSRSILEGTTHSNDHMEVHE